MIIGSNQPYLFPYIGYWQLMNASDIYVISDSMQYIKKGYVNRNYVLLNGERHRFSLEVVGVHGDTPINEVKVGNNSRKIISMLSHTYKKAPHFDSAFPIIESILQNDEKNLAKYLGNSIQVIADYLDMNTKFMYLSDMQGETSLKAQARTIDICKRASASQYINAIGGQELYDKESFLKENIALSFLETGDVNYKQFYNEFVPYLSIVDIMMFNSKDTIKEMLKVYTLV